MKRLVLYLSILFNFILLLIVAYQEKQSHVFSLALERRDLVQLSNQSHPGYWDRVGWENSIEKLHTDFDVAFFGNSITRGSDFQSFFQDKSIINLGLPGDTMTGMLNRVSMLTKANPSKVFIMAGTNDLVHISLEKYEQRYIKLLDAVRDSIPNAKIYIQSVIPSNHSMRKTTAPNSKVQEANKIAERLCQEYGITFVNIYDAYIDDKNELKKDFTRDGIHLHPQSYDKWADIIKPYIYE